MVEINCPFYEETVKLTYKRRTLIFCSKDCPYKNLVKDKRIGWALDYWYACKTEGRIKQSKLLETIESLNEIPI